MITQFSIMVWGLLGAVVYKLANYSSNGKNNKNSPTKFSFSYWIQDRKNWNDMVFGGILFAIIATYKDVFFNTYPDLFLVQWLKPFKDIELFYFIIGLFMTFIIRLARNLIVFVGQNLSKVFKSKN